MWPPVAGGTGATKVKATKMGHPVACGTRATEVKAT